MTIRRAEADTFFWLTQCTKTKDEQAPEGTDPFRPFPQKGYIKDYLNFLENFPVGGVEKSRTVMASWTAAGWATHKAVTRPATGIVFQSRDEDRALKDVDYCRILYENSLPELQEIWPLEKPMSAQPRSRITWKDGSWIAGFVGDPDKIRSEHPTYYFLDEAAIVPNGLENISVAQATLCKGIKFLSSAKPGWYESYCDGDFENWPKDWEILDDEPGRKPTMVSFCGVRIPRQGVSLKRNAKGVPILRLHYTADPEKRSAEWKEKYKATFASDAMWRQEMEIEYDATAGQRVYPEFERAVHVIPQNQIPPRLTRFCSIDPHPRTPHAVIWVGISKWGDWYVYRELWPSKVRGRTEALRDDQEENEPFTVREYAETIAKLEGNRIEIERPGHPQERGRYIEQPHGEHIQMRFMDQAGKGFKISGEAQPFESMATRYARYGIHCYDPFKNIDVGEEAIHALLKPRSVGRGEAVPWPKLHIADSCTETILEFERLRFQQINPSRLDEVELKQEPVAARRHMLDNLRYLATSQIRFLDRQAS